MDLRLRRRVCGGVWTIVSAFTPSALVADFQHGLVRADLVLLALTLTGAGLGLAMLWQRPGVRVTRRVRDSVVLAAITDRRMAIGTSHASAAAWDASESRRNSIPPQAEQKRPARPHTRRRWRSRRTFAPSDPRRQQLEATGVRQLQHHHATRHGSHTSTRTSSGLYEQSRSRIRRDRATLNGPHRVMSRDGDR